MSAGPHERIGPRVSHFNVSWPILCGVILAVLGFIPAAKDPSRGNILGGLLWIGCIGGAYLWGGWDAASSSTGVLVRDHDDLFVIRDGFGRSRRVAWRSVASFRATDGVGFVDLRDGSSLRLFSVSNEGADIDQIRGFIERLTAMLEQRYGPQDSRAATAPFERLEPHVGRTAVIVPLMLGTFTTVFIPFSLALNPENVTNVASGVAIVILGTPYLWFSRHEARRRGGVVVRDHDDQFVVRSGFGRPRRVAWGSVARVRAIDGVGVAELKDGQRIRLFSPRWGQPLESADQIHEQITHLNAILEERRAPRDSVSVLDSEREYERIGPVISRRGAVIPIVVGIVVVVACVAGVAADPGGNGLGGGLIFGAIFASPYLWFGSREAKRRPGVLIADHDELFHVHDDLGESRGVAWRSVARFRATDDGVGLADLYDGSSVRLLSPSGVASGTDEFIERLNMMLERRA